MTQEFKEKCTFITPYYNTPLEIFEFYAENIVKHGINVVICDDGSDDEYRDNLHRILGGHPLVKIITLKENMGHTQALKLVFSEVETEFLIRCDADDGYVNLPEFKDENWDVLLLQKTQDNLDEFLVMGGSAVGSIYRTDVFKETFLCDFEFQDKNEKWIHQDLWQHFSLLDSKYKFQYASNIGIYHRRRHDFSMTFLKNIHPQRKRWETFMLWCMENGKFDLYLEKQRKILTQEKLYKRQVNVNN